MRPQLDGEFVHPLDVDHAEVGVAEQPEDPCPSQRGVEVPMARHDVDVEVVEALGLGEQEGVGLLAAGDVAKRGREGAQQWSERVGLTNRQLVECHDVAAGEHDEPTFEVRVERVRDDPAAGLDYEVARGR